MMAIKQKFEGQLYKIEFDIGLDQGSQPWIRGSIWLRGVTLVDPRKNSK
jgi:hypothetical protein